MPRAKDMSINDIESVLLRKKEEERLERQRVEEARSMSPPRGNLEALMKQQMEFQKSMMIQMHEQQKELEKQRREMEAKRDMDEMKFDMKKIELLLTMKQVNEVSNRPYQNPGSVKARVGPKNSLTDETKLGYGNVSPPADQRSGRVHATWSNSQPHSGIKRRNHTGNNSNNNEFRKRKRFPDDKKLPPELILTNLTEKGPLPAASRRVVNILQRMFNK